MVRFVEGGSRDRLGLGLGLGLGPVAGTPARVGGSAWGFLHGPHLIKVM